MRLVFRGVALLLSALVSVAVPAQARSPAEAPKLEAATAITTSTERRTALLGILRHPASAKAHIREACLQLIEIDLLLRDHETARGHFVACTERAAFDDLYYGQYGPSGNGSGNSSEYLRWQSLLRALHSPSADSP